MKKIELEIGSTLANLLGAWTTIGCIIYAVEKVFG